jgi:hypothetical protein
MSDPIDLEGVGAFFKSAIDTYGTSPQGVNWNSEDSQRVRFAQLIKVCDLSRPFSINDYGCGCGALVEYLDEQRASFSYAGYDIVAKMIDEGRALHPNRPEVTFTTQEAELTPKDYTVESGVFNIRFDYSNDEWREYVIKTLHKMDALSTKGFSFNCLTKYSDPERMRPNLYYADPGFLFDYCKRIFARNVALLHDYDLYDFTILVRK